MRSWAMLVLSETKMVLRDYAGVLVPLGLPLMILVTSAGMGGDEVLPNGRTVIDVYIMPVVLTIVIGMVAIVNMPSFLSGYRKHGVLKQLAVTPISPLRVIGAQVFVSVAQTLVGIAIAYVVAVIAYGAGAPGNLLGAVGVFLLALLALYSVGALISSIAPSQNSAIALGLLAFLGMGALGGMFGGVAALPEALARVGRLLPFGAANESLSAAFAGASIPGELVLCLAAWAVICTVVSVLTFRWDR